MLLSFLLCLPLLAQDPEQEEPVKKKEDGRHKIQPAILPLVYYSPETKLSVGATGLLLFKTDTTARTSFVDFLALYTQRHQVIIEPLWTIFTKNEKYFIKGTVYYSRFPDYYFGIGNETGGIAQDIQYRIFRVNNWILQQVKPHLFIGPQYQFYKTFDVHFPHNAPNPVPVDQQLYDDANIPGFTGSVSSGLGLATVYDTRDHTTNPHKGWYIELSGFSYNKYLGSQFDFVSILTDIRKYIPLSKKATFAVALANNLNIGDVPFKQLAFLGGTRFMRGYYEGRYRDKNSIILQAEYRQSVYRRWGFVIFGTVGNVYKDIPNLLQSNLKWTVGAGLRFKINRKENTNARVDYGIGQNTRGFYGNFAEAF